MADTPHDGYDRLEKRIRTMYVDKLDGVVSTEFFEQNAGTWREEQKRIETNIEQLQKAGASYIDDGIQLLNLVQLAPRLFEKQPATEKRRLLNFMVSNSVWENGGLKVDWKQPFDMIVHNSGAERLDEGAKSDDLAVNEKWLPVLYRIRTECQEEVLDLATHAAVIQRDFGVAA